MSDGAAVMPTDAERSGLDHEFLRYIGGDREGQRRIQEFYLPRFARCENVVDLGCGDGVFVELLMERDISVTGVDLDDKAYAAAKQRALPIVQDDVLHYLRALPPCSVDGFFCAHLVEHLPYEQVMELVQLGHRALKHGGVLVIATPDVRSLYSHLEMFYLHFGHVSFYHPRLLCFFLDQAGFIGTEYGTNPNSVSPMLEEVNELAAVFKGNDVLYQREIPLQGKSLLHRASYALKRRLAEWLVLPFLDSMTESVNREIEATRAKVRTLASSLQSLNGPFECYALAYKPSSPTKEPKEPQTMT